MITELDVSFLKKPRAKELLNLLEKYQLTIIFKRNFFTKYYLISKKAADKINCTDQNLGLSLEYFAFVKGTLKEVIDGAFSLEGLFDTLSKSNKEINPDIFSFISEETLQKGTEQINQLLNER